MTIATHETHEEKQRLIERAIVLKPREHGVFATDRGWAIKQPRGTIELLVSFPGLAELLSEDKLVVEKSVEPIVEEKAPVEPIVEEKAPVDDEEDEPVIAAPAKRGPKPKAK